MKSDKLEKFVNSHREEFDDLVPDPGIWGKISEDIRPVKRIRPMSILWKAAAVLIIFISSYFFHEYISFRDKHVISENIEEIDLESAKQLEMLMEAEAYYTSRIQTTKKEVFRLAGNNNQITDIVYIEFEELDQALKELKEDLQDNAATQEVIEAMIQNYRLKLMILEEMMMQMKEAQNNSEQKEQTYEHAI